MKLSSLLTSGFWTTYGALGTRLLVLLSNLILARLLLPSEFGVISVAYIFWSFLNLFTQGTINSFIVYKGIEDQRYLNTTYTIAIARGLMLAVAMVAISPLAANFFGVPDLVGILVVFAFNLLVASIQSVYQGVLTRQMRYRQIAHATIIASLVRVVSTTGCAFIGLSYWSFAVGDAAFRVIEYWISRRHVEHKFRLEIDPQASSEVLSFCFGATGSSLGFYVNANGDNFVIGKLLGNTNLGYYNFAYQLTQTINTVMGEVINQVGMSSFAQLENDEEQQSVLVTMVEQMAFLGAPLYALFFLVVDDQLISMIFGQKWVPACQVIPWLLVFAYFRLINNSLINMLAAKGRTGINAKVNLMIAPVAFLSFIIGAEQAGILGVGIAVTFVLGIVWTVYWWWVACRALGWPLIKFLLPCFKAALIVLLAIVSCLGLPIILKPFLFISLYIVCMRLIAAKQFFSYQSLLGKLANQLTKLGKSQL